MRQAKTRNDRCKCCDQLFTYTSTGIRKYCDHCVNLPDHLRCPDPILRKGQITGIIYRDDEGQVKSLRDLF